MRRLRTDFIDLYQVHRDDPTTPLAETLEAFSRLVTAGKVRAIGARTRCHCRGAQEAGKRQLMLVLSEGAKGTRPKPIEISLK